MTVLQVMQKLHDDVNEFGLRSFVTGVRHAATTIAHSTCDVRMLPRQNTKRPGNITFPGLSIEGLHSQELVMPA
jgi:hypothetical protein